MSLTAIVLTFNEEKHLERCLRSLQGICSEVCIVDSFSTDKTLQIAERYGARICQHKWTNYSSQFNWALANCGIQTDWILRIDADEYLSDELRHSISKQLSSLGSDISGVYVKRLMYFMGEPLRRGGMYPIWHLKIWRNGTGCCEERWMDEHIRLSDGKTCKLEGDLIDNNLNNLTWWTQKHNLYATREAIDLLDIRYDFSQKNTVSPRLFGTQEQRKRWAKIKYASLPLFTRPFLYFMYRYILKGGFLEGKRGFIWSILQALWYRFLVDVKIYEACKKAGREKSALITYFKDQHKLDIT